MFSSTHPPWAPHPRRWFLQCAKTARQEEEPRPGMAQLVSAKKRHDVSRIGWTRPCSLASEVGGQWSSETSWATMLSCAATRACALSLLVLRVSPGADGDVSNVHESVTAGTVEGLLTAPDRSRFQHFVHFRPVGENNALRGGHQKLLRGVYARHHERSGAEIFLTPDGVKRGTRIARMPEHKRWDRVFNATCIGVPWQLRSDQWNLARAVVSRGRSISRRCTCDRDACRSEN